jgi:biopolymer transport protein ExbD
VVLHINRNGAFEVGIEDELGASNGCPVAPGDLRAQLERLYANRPLDRVLYLKADSSLPFGVIDEALASARRAGVRVVATVTERRGR